MDTTEKDAYMCAQGSQKDACLVLKLHQVDILNEYEHYVGTDHQSNKS